MLKASRPLGCLAAKDGHLHPSSQVQSLLLCLNPLNQNPRRPHSARTNPKRYPSILSKSPNLFLFPSKSRLRNQSRSQSRSRNSKKCQFRRMTGLRLPSSLRPVPYPLQLSIVSVLVRSSSSSSLLLLLLDLRRRRCPLLPPSLLPRHLILLSGNRRLSLARVRRTRIGDNPLIRRYLP